MENKTVFNKDCVAKCNKLKLAPERKLREKGHQT